MGMLSVEEVKKRNVQPNKRNSVLRTALSSSGLRGKFVDGVKER